MYYPDISHYRQVQNWTTVKKNCAFLISRATQGGGAKTTKHLLNGVDRYLDTFIKGCEKNAIPYWLYCYLERGDEKKQAEFMVKTCKNKIGKWFVGYILDVEEDNLAKNVKEAMDYLLTVSKKIMVYTGYRHYDKYAGILATRAKNVCWWESRYGRNTGTYSSAYPCHTGIDFHQYTSEGQCAGIDGGVDLNRLTGTKNLDFFTSVSTKSTEKSVKEQKKVTVATTVRVGSARIDERGRAYGGVAGDQTGREVASENWYNHSLGWYVIRAKDKAKREKIAQNMEYACNNANIGYDQYQNQTLWNVAKNVGYNCKKVTTPCETDCARLVRVCVWYAGIKCDDFYTATELNVLKATGQFDVLTDAKYCNQSKYLKRGDILVTRSKGHTVVVLNDGMSAEGETVKPTPAPTPSVPIEDVIFTYSVKADDKIYPPVTNLTDYAGVVGKPITDIAIKVNKGSVRYRVHVRNGAWLPWVTGYNWKDYDNGYAGVGKIIDAVQVELSGVSGQKAQYHVSPVGKNYFDWQYNTETTNGQDGYAGSFGIAIDRFQIW